MYRGRVDISQGHSREVILFTWIQVKRMKCRHMDDDRTLLEDAFGQEMILIFMKITPIILQNTTEPVTPTSPDASGLSNKEPYLRVDLVSNQSPVELAGLHVGNLVCRIGHIV